MERLLSPLRSWLLPEHHKSGRMSFLCWPLRQSRAEYWYCHGVRLYTTRETRGTCCDFHYDGPDGYDQECLFASLILLTYSRSSLWPYNRRYTRKPFRHSIHRLTNIGYVTENKSWRWTQWTILFGLVVAFALAVFMSESYKTVLLKRRAKRLGVKPPPELQTSTLYNIKYFVTKTISRPIYMMLTEPIVGLFDLYNAFNFGLLNAFFAAFSWV